MTIDRFDVLDAARAAVTQREHSYGGPEDNFTRIAAGWQLILQDGPAGQVQIGPVQVALMLVWLKIVRAGVDPSHMDNFVDIAGYAACAGEVAAQRAAEDEEIARATEGRQPNFAGVPPATEAQS